MVRTDFVHPQYLLPNHARAFQKRGVEGQAQRASARLARRAPVAATAAASAAGNAGADTITGARTALGEVREGDGWNGHDTEVAREIIKDDLLVTELVTMGFGVVQNVRNPSSDCCGALIGRLNSTSGLHKLPH